MVSLTSRTLDVIDRLFFQVLTQTQSLGTHIHFAISISWNLGPLGIHAAQPYIAQARRKKAAIVMLQEIRIPRGSKFSVQRDFWRKYPEYECYIAAGSNVDLVADTDGD